MISLRFIAIMALILIVSCKGGTEKPVACNIVTPTDSCLYQEFIGGMSRGKMDTLCFIRINLRTWEKQFFVNDKIDVGIEVIRTSFEGGNYSYNVTYCKVDKTDKWDKFIEATHSDKVYNSNFSGKKIGANVGAYYQLMMDKEKIVGLPQNLVDSNRLQSIADMIRDNSVYSKVVMYSFLSDSKNSTVATIDCN